MKEVHPWPVLLRTRSGEPLLKGGFGNIRILVYFPPNFNTLCFRSLEMSDVVKPRVWQCL